MYRLEMSPRSQRRIVRLERRLVRGDWERLNSAVQKLAEEPRPDGARKIAGQRNCYRIRVGDHRIMYEVRDADSTLVILKIGRRNRIHL